jgi:polyisoprenoid-binding protein YceI
LISKGSKLLGVTVLLALPLYSQVESWRIDPQHSSAQFSVRHMMISTVRGQFGAVNGTIAYDRKNPEKSSVEATIECSTVYTGEPKRDEQLKTAEFFDVQHYPLMRFKSTHIVSHGRGTLVVSGNLTINAITKPVILQVEGPTPSIKDTQGREKAGVTANTTLSRKSFGILYNPVMETGGVAVSDEVSVVLDIELIRNGESK